MDPLLMPARSEAQRRYLNARFGHDWVKKHDFDNKGKLPKRSKRKRRGRPSIGDTRRAQMDSFRRMGAQRGRRA